MSTILWAPAEDLSPDEMSVLRRGDPALGAPLTIDPFPGSNWRDLVVEIHGELGIGPARSGLLLNQGRADDPLRAWDVRTIIVLEAQSAAPGALSGMVAAVHRAGCEIVFVLSDDPRRGAHLADIQADRHPAGVTPLRETTQRHREWPLAELEAATELLSAAELELVAAIAEQAGEAMRRFPRNLQRVAVHHAADELFVRPLSAHGQALRLHGLDVALARRGYRMIGLPFPELVRAAAAEHPRSWLDSAVSPQLRSLFLPLAPHEIGQPLNSATADAFLASVEKPLTRRVYSNAIRKLADWRVASGIPPQLHRADDLERWAIDNVLEGVAPTTINMRLTVATRYLRTLLTGEARPELPQRFAPDLEPARVPTAIDQARDRLHRRLFRWEDSTQVFQTRRPTLPFTSPRGRKFLAHFDGDFEAAWAAIHSSEISPEVWTRIEGIFAEEGWKRQKRSRRALEAVLLVLTTGIRWSWIPPEAGLGAPGTIKEHLKHWIHDGRWSALVTELRKDERYAEVDWNRAA